MKITYLLCEPNIFSGLRFASTLCNPLHIYTSISPAGRNTIEKKTIGKVLIMYVCPIIFHITIVIF